MVRSLSRPVYAGLLARVPVPISLGMRAHWHGYAGRDKELTLYVYITVVYYILSAKNGGWKMEDKGGRLIA